MIEVAAGAASGVLMGKVFIVVGALTLFSLTQDPPLPLKSLVERGTFVTLAVPLTVLSLATWAGIGAVLGLLYYISLRQAPGSGLGSPNLAYTVGVALVVVAMAPPLLILLRRVLKGLLTLMLAFVGIFGWFLPFIAG